MSCLLFVRVSCVYLLACLVANRKCDIGCLYCRYANVLKEQGKLIRLEEYDTNHAGCLPGISNRGVADGSMPRAMKILKEHLAK